MMPTASTSPAVSLATTEESLLRRARAAGRRAARAKKRQQRVAREYAAAFQSDDLQDQPIIPPWLALMLGSILLALLYLAWQTPG